MRDTTYQNIEYLLKRKKERKLEYPIVEIKVMEMDENRHEIDSIINYWRLRGAWTTTRRLISWAGMVDEIAPKADKDRKACGNAVGILPITWEGDAVCCVMDVDATIKYGNVREDSIRDIWKKRNEILVEKHLNHRWDELPDICKNCSDWMIIGENRYDENGNMVEKSYDLNEKMLSK